MINLENVCFKYKNSDYILKNINFSVNNGEVIAIVGKNGSGKSTLGRLIAGITKLKEGIRIIVSLVIGIIYAASDEIHQSFVPGRSPQITDVMIDTMGVLLGILLVMLCLNIFSKIKQRTKKIENS